MPNLVLCLGEDGHIAFEWQHERQCDHDNVQETILFGNLEEENSEAGEINCTDIDLHFHPSSANITAKTSNFTIVNNVFDFDFLPVTDRTNRLSSINKALDTPLDLLIEEIKNTILII